MSSGASVSESGLQRALLAARDHRQHMLDLALEGASKRAAIITVGTNIPGEDKHLPGVSRLMKDGLEALRERMPLDALASVCDALGPFLVARSGLSPDSAKRIAIATETRDPAARLLDVDVYCADGRPVDRIALGQPPRTCLVCGQPAGTCMRLRRHSHSEIQARARALLSPLASLPRRVDPEVLAGSLVEGALQELDLSPKPGLVDRFDPGSHPDLTYASMRASALLLEVYFEDILRCHRGRRPLEDFVQAGLAAEQRMVRAVRTNSHKGYIFLSGLLLMGACECQGGMEALRRAIAGLASRFFGTSFPAHAAHGPRLGGIRDETLRGLPSIFEHGWPRYREALSMGWPVEEAGFMLMGVLMQHVEDSTAIRRCGQAGLSRLRRDGSALQRLVGRCGDPRPRLSALNHDYQAMNLTMGGVADCMGLTFALQHAAG